MIGQARHVISFSWAPVEVAITRLRVKYLQVVQVRGMRKMTVDRWELVRIGFDVNQKWDDMVAADRNWPQVMVKTIDEGSGHWIH